MPKIDKNILVYFPVEIMQREYAYKSEIVKLLTSNGYSACLMPLDDLFDDLLSGKASPGIVVVKSIQRYLFIKLLILRLLGNFIIYMEEEAWVPFNDEDIVRRRYPRRNRYLFRVYNRVSLFGRDRIRLVGSNRMRIKEDTSFHSSKNVILLGSIVSVSWDRYWEIYKSELGILGTIYKRLYRVYYDKLSLDHEVLLEIGLGLLERGWSVSYRPHPAEDVEVFADNRIRILDNRLSVSDQSKLFDVILHSGSTAVFELGTSNVVAVSHHTTEDIHANSKCFGPLVNNVGQLDRFLSGGINCAYNNEDYVNPFDIDSFNGILELIWEKERHGFKFLSVLFILYKKFFLNSRRNMELIRKRRDAWDATHR